MVLSILMPMSGKGSKTAVSLYWHIPFCSQKCGYCHFYVLPDKESLKDQLLEGLALEFAVAQPLLKDSEVVSIYFGGGTPALFGPKRIQTLLEWQREQLTLVDDCEITLEANPDELTPALLDAYRAVGINRLSIGVQSLDDTLLATLTRRHTAQKAVDIIHAATAAGFDNITIDLMYEVPGQTMTSWQRTLDQAAALPIAHLSLYNLTIEPHTQFFKQQKQLTPLIPDAETSLQMYEAAVTTLQAASLQQYEVSAFAKAKHQSRHNSGYWTGRPFYGFGPSAFSYWHGRRFRNVANQSRYIKALENNQSPIDFEETLSPEAHRRELFVIQLRLVEGVHLDSFTSTHGPLEAETIDQLGELITHGLLTKQAGILKLTDRGRLCYDAVAAELV